MDIKNLGFTIKRETIAGQTLILLKFNDQCDLGNPDIRKYKGAIIDEESGKVIVQNYSTPIDYSIDDSVKFIEKFEGCKPFELIDGTMFRIYFLNGQWRVSTNGMITPDKGWSSPKSFLELFQEGLSKKPIDFDQLNRDYVYLVILKHPVNTIVVKYPRPELVHVGTMDMTTGLETDADIGLIKPEEYQEPLSDLVAKLSHDQAPVTFAGFLIKDKDGQRYRIESNDYITARGLRANHSSILVALMDVRDDSEKVAQFEKYFGLNLEKSLERISKIILTHYTKYRKLKIPNYHDKIPPQYLPVIHKVHGLYIKNRENSVNRPICLEDVKTILYDLDPVTKSRVFS